jgi:WD40 repeat protein
MIDNLLTQHKVPTAMDGTENLILTGQENGEVKLYDLRESTANHQKIRNGLTFTGHQRSVSQLKINPASENVFITAGLDGLLKLWDSRNNASALYSLKRKNETPTEEIKLFGAAWNGASQILSGGSDSHISSH